MKKTPALLFILILTIIYPLQVTYAQIDPHSIIVGTPTPITSKQSPTSAATKNVSPTAGQSSSTGASGDNATGTGTICIEGKPCDKSKAGSSSSSGSSDSLVQAGADLVKAYEDCGLLNAGGENTILNSNSSSCLPTELKKTGRYGDIGLNAFKQHTINQTDVYGGCVQCIGFVREALELANNTDEDNFNPQLYQDAGAFYDLNQFQAGKSIYKRAPDRAPEVGDIAIYGRSLPNSDGHGHISIVYKVAGAQIFTYEANWKGCTATSDRPHTLDDDPYEPIHFFRKQ